MGEHKINRSLISREKAIHRYIQALDQGEMDGVAAVLDAALYDPELDRVITEINLAYQEEEQLTPIATDAQLVRNLLRKHLNSAFEVEELDQKPLTVGDVAARLQAERRVPPSDQEANRLLLSSSVPLPAWLSAPEIKQLVTGLGVVASERFWRVFRDTAITLAMGRSPSQAQLTAAREARARYTVRSKNNQASRPSSTDTDQEKNQ